jgi:hypothetical protein
VFKDMTEHIGQILEASDKEEKSESSE